MHIPPSTHRTCPVTYPASLEAKKLTAAATSAGSPIFLSGMLSLISSRILSLMAPVMSVAIKPGATAFTVIFLLASSRAAVFIRSQVFGSPGPGGHQALKGADIGVAMGAGSDLAVENADIVS